MMSVLLIERQYHHEECCEVLSKALRRFFASEERVEHSWRKVFLKRVLLEPDV